MSERECYISAINGVTMPQSPRRLTLDLPFPPTVNRYWRHIGESRTIISKQGRAYKIAVAGLVMANRAALQLCKPVCVSVTYCPPDNRRRDLDNYTKALLDSITAAGVWQDDSQVQIMHLQWGAIMPGGKATVTIAEI